MASLDHRLNPLFSIKECSSCGALYTADFCCSKGSLEDKILVPKPPQNCTTCGDPVDGLYCRPCAFVRKCLNEGWYTIHDENEILNTSESSNDNTNIVSAPQEPFVFNQDPGVNSSQSPLQINHNCCYKCGDSLDDIFCQRCTCKSCGNGAHIGYNCPPKAPIISNPEQCNQTINELPQTLPSVHPTCNSGDENSFTYDSKPNSVDDSPNVFNPPPQPSMYSCELCGNDTHHSYDCPPQVPFLMEQMTSICDMVGQIMQKKEEERRIAEDQAAKDRYWKIPICYDDDEDYTIAIIPILSTKEAVDSLIMEDEHLDTIPATELDKVIKSSIENLVPIPSEFKGISEDTCDVPVCEDPSTFDALSNHSEILSDSNNDGTSSDDDSYENIDRLVTNIESLKDNPTPDRVLKSPFSFPIPIMDSDSFFEESDTSFSYSDNSLPEFKTFSDHTEETRSGSTTTHANNSLPEYDSFLFEVEPDQGRLISISFLRPPPEPPNVEISLIIETDAPVINNVDELNEDECFDPGGAWSLSRKGLGCADDESRYMDDLAFKPLYSWVEVKDSTDIAKITRKRSKLDKHGHGNGKENTRAGRMLSKLRSEPLPKIDPKDKGKKKFEEEDKSDTEYEGIPEAKKKFKQLARDEEMARKVQEDWEAEEEVKKLAEEEAIKAALSNEYYFIQA
ncbi:hypothetical protein Tco_0411881 [Tanacetum coccineum]